MCRNLKEKRTKGKGDAFYKITNSMPKFSKPVTGPGPPEEHSLTTGRPAAPLPGPGMTASAG